MHDNIPPEDPELTMLLRQHWQAPAAPPLAAQRLLAAATAMHRPAQRLSRARWALPGAALAATLFAGLWVVLPEPRTFQAPAASVVSPADADMSDEQMASYIFATYPLEETL